MNEARRIVGHISSDVVNSLSLPVAVDTPIYIAESNILHIRDAHPDAYIEYFHLLDEIIATPDYIGIAGVYAPSIEYIKCFRAAGQNVNVAVRATKAGVHYVRSMFLVEDGRITDYIKKGILKPLDKSVEETIQ